MDNSNRGFKKMNIKVITKFDREEIEVKYDKFLSLRLDAIKIIKKYIEIFRNNKDYTSVVEGLELGLSILEAGHKRYK
jgi:septum formation topological specificity factor MinE